MGKIFQVRVQVAPPSAGAPDHSPIRFAGPNGTYFLPEYAYHLARAEGYAFEVRKLFHADELPVRFLLPHDGAINDPPPESARLAVLAKLMAEGRADGDTHVRFVGRHRSVPAGGFVLDRIRGERRYVWETVPSEELVGRQDLADRFEALRRHLTDPNRRVVLALGSGGLKLFAHSTILRLLSRIGVDSSVDEVWGCSGGALVSLLYASGISPHAIEEAGYDLYAGRYELPLRPSRLELLRGLLRDTIWPAQDSASAGFVDAASGLQRMLERYSALQRPVKPFYSVAFNLREGLTQVLTPASVPEHLSDFVHQVDPTDAALASAAVPLLFVPKLLQVSGGSAPFIDGSTTEGVPLYTVVRKWDADRRTGNESREKLTVLYVKLTEGSERASRGRISKLRLLRAVASAGVESMHDRTVDLLGHRPDVDLFGIQLETAGADFFETGNIPDFIRISKESFPDQLSALEAELRRKDMSVVDSVGAAG